AAGLRDGYEVANRLSFGLWDSPPDAELLKAAAAGQLSTREQVAKQAERMLADPRAHAKLRDFLHTWLKVDHPPDVAKDPKRFPGFGQDVVSDLRTSLDLFLDDVVWGTDSDFRQLLLCDSLPIHGRLAKFYGVPRKDGGPRTTEEDGLLTAVSVLQPSAFVLHPAAYVLSPAEDGAFRSVKLNPEERAGVLTHPYLMAAFSYTGATSPIHRGVFVARGVLGIALRPPPDAFTPLPEELHPTLTTRERVAMQTKATNCQSCHGVINPLGFTLERFDAVGRMRQTDNGRPVDATGLYQTPDGKTVKFTGAREFAKFLADSP